MTEQKVGAFGEDTIRQEGVVTGFDIKCIKSEKISEKSNKETWGLIINIDLQDGTKIDCSWDVNRLNNVEFVDNKRLYSDVEHLSSIPFILGCCGADKISELVGKTVLVARNDTAIRISPAKDNETNKRYWVFANDFKVY